MIRGGCVAYRLKSSLESTRASIWSQDEQWAQRRDHNIATLHGPAHPSFLSTPRMLPGWLRGESHLLSGARAALSNWMPRPRLLKNLCVCPPAWEPHESPKGCVWLRHCRGGWKQVSWPCCVTWTLSSECQTQLGPVGVLPAFSEAHAAAHTESFHVPVCPLL